MITSKTTGSICHISSALVTAFSAVVMGLAPVIFSSEAGASILFGPSISGSTDKTMDQTGFAGGDSSSTVVNADGKLGLLIEGTVLYVGGIYSYESLIGSSATKMTGAGYGPTVGIFKGAFALLGSYILDATRTYSSNGADSKLASGSGYRVDLSYVAGLTNSIGIGPQLTYRDIKYAKSTPAGGVETSNTYQESTFAPSLIFWFRF